MRRAAVALTLALLPWAPATAEEQAAPRPALSVDLSALEPAVAEQLGSLRELVAESAGGDSDAVERATAWGELGEAYQAYSLWEAAEDAYAEAEAAASSPGSRWTYYRAHALRAMGDLESAAAAFEAVVATHPEQTFVQLYLAETYLDLDRLDKARLHTMAAQELEPSAAGLALLGRIDLAEERYDEAIEHLEAALAAVPAATRLHYPLALAYRGKGEMEKAREHLAQVGEVGLKPDDPLLAEVESVRQGERAYLLLGRRAFGAGRYEEAAKAFARAVEAAPESARARINLGSALGLLGRTDEAAEQFETALELEPDNPTALFNLGQIAEGAGDLSTARQRYEAALAIDPGDEEAILGEARVLVGLRQYATALAGLEAAHLDQPESGRIAFALARLLAASPAVELRDGERALDLAGRIYDASPTIGHLHLVATALAELGRCDEAAEWLRRGVEAAGAESDLGRQLVAELDGMGGAATCRPPADSPGAIAGTPSPGD